MALPLPSLIAQLRPFAIPRLKATSLGEASGGDRLPVRPKNPIQHLSRARAPLRLHCLQHPREDHPGVWLSVSYIARGAFTDVEVKLNTEGSGI